MITTEKPITEHSDSGNMYISVNRIALHLGQTSDRTCIIKASNLQAFCLANPLIIS